MSTYLNIAQIIIGAALVGVILLQTRGSGMGGVFGGSQTSFQPTRRGVERTLFTVTIVLSVAFFAITLVNALTVQTTGPVG
ncbi:MAG: preprotein translocase subunit SecG [Anaerolineae bacterium]|jgi:preprotein translocase subunit SecG